MEIELETRTLREQWGIWTHIRDKFNEEHGNPDIDTGTKYVGAKNPYYGEFMDLGERYWKKPSAIIKKNLIAIGKAKKELVGYSYDWDAKVPYTILLNEIDWTFRDGSFYIIHN